MSTPSTALATHPHVAHQQYYSHHPQYQSNIINGQYTSGGTPRLSNGSQQLYTNGYPSQAPAATTTSNPDLRRAAAANVRPSQQLPPISSNGYSPSDMSASKRGPDWASFYKNGVPREVIVIDDTPEPPTAQQTQTSQQNSSKPVAANGPTKHADKKRKTAASATYNPIYHNDASYSTTHTPYSNHTVSTDRTTSGLHTTAATSLGSNGSSGYAAPADEGVTGQKRKRSSKKTADEEKQAKRREYEQPNGETMEKYYPPSQPIKKSKEVKVDVVHDRSATKNQKVDDDDGHYIVKPEVDLTDRYVIVRLLGQGTFGKVVEAIDRHRNARVAIKVIRSVQKYRDASRIELRVLQTLAANDSRNRNRCIHLRDCFDYRNHICIVTDLYGQSVFDFLKSNQFVPFPSTHIQRFARQLFTSVAFLHDLSLIHTDLKPENILLVNNAYQTFTYSRTIPSSSTTTSRTARHRRVLLDPEIRLIDFGSATFNEEYHSSVVSTRHYRAPEIILNMGWSYPCDIWSIGCILVEFYTGDALFQTHDNLEHLAMMEAVCGYKIDREIIRTVLRGDRGSSKNPSASYFKNSKLDYPNSETPKTSRKYVKAMKKLHDTIPPTNEFNRQFLDLLRQIFVYNPDKRVSAKGALDHPWFREPLNDDGTEANRIRLEKERKARAQLKMPAPR